MASLSTICRRNVVLPSNYEHIPCMVNVQRQSCDMADMRYCYAWHMTMLRQVKIVSS